MILWVLHPSTLILYSHCLLLRVYILNLVGHINQHFQISRYCWIHFPTISNCSLGIYSLLSIVCQSFLFKNTPQKKNNYPHFPSSKRILFLPFVIRSSQFHGFTPVPNPTKTGNIWDGHRGWRSRQQAWQLSLCRPGTEELPRYGRNPAPVDRWFIQL